MDPSELENVRLWVAADKIEGLSDGDPVGEWKDLSGEGNHLTSEGADRPTYKTNITKGHPVVRFENDVLRDKTFSKAEMAGAFVFIVYTIRSNPGSFKRILSFAPNESSNDYEEGLALDLGSAGQTEDNYLNIIGRKSKVENIDSKTSSDAFGTFSRVTVDYFDNSTTRLWVDGTAEGTRTADADKIKTTQFRLGRDWYLGSEHTGANLDVAELIIVEGALTTEEREAIEKYLGRWFAEAPVATTGEADEVDHNSATLNGTVDPNGSPTTYWFEYGTTKAYGTKIPAGEDGEAGEGTEAVAVDEAISGLEPETTYHFRLVATNAGGTDTGEDETFTTDEKPIVPPEPIAVVREYPPDRLAIEVVPPDGAPARWAADEPLAENVASGIRLSDEMPGGYKELTTTLARNPRTPWPDLTPFGEVRAYGPGGETIWEGRLDKAPEADGDHASIEPAAVGWQAALEDNKALMLGFLDADLSKWGEPSTERRLQLIEAGIRLMGSSSVGKASLDPEAVEAAIVHDFNNVTTVATDTEAAETVYDAGGVDIGEVRYDYSGDLSGVGASTNWESNIAVGTTDTFATATTGTDHDASAVENKSVSGGTGYTFARIRNRLNAVSEGEDLKRIFAWQPKVIGNHGLAAQGTWPEIGFTAKQMLEYAVPLHTPLLVSDEALEDDGYVIPQAWFSEPGSMAQVVQELTKYGLLDWFVFEGKLFQLRFPGTYGRKWQAYAGPSQLQEVGEDASRLWRSIVVRYQDVDGSTRTVGPPGSGATVEDEGLEISDPEHPAVRAELTRQDVLDMKGVGVAASAIAVGERWLEEANELSRSGSCSLSGYVLDDRGVMRPVSQVRSGDQVRFPDAGDTGYRKIVARTYDHDTRTTSLTLDAPPNAIEALLERLQAALIPLGL